MNKSELYIMPLWGRHKRRPVPSSPVTVTAHSFSPEARKIIWRPVVHIDEKLDIQHNKTSQ